MAEAEYAGMGTFLTSLASSWKGQRREQKRKHEQWMSCIMGGISAEDCTRILGYDPGEEARGGAESIAAGRRAEEIEERHQEKLKFGRETAEKYTDIPVEEAGELDIPVDWKQAMITPERVTTAVKMRPGEISRARWARGAPERELAEEERAETRGLAKEKRVEKRQIAKEKRAEIRAGAIEGGTPEERIRKKWESLVADIEKTNLKSQAEITGFAYTPITAPTFKEFRSSFRESADPKAEAKAVFDEAKSKGLSKEEMLKNYEKFKTRLLNDGVDLAHLLKLISGYNQ